MFEQPWAHQADEYRIRHNLTSADWRERTAAELRQHIWAYRDAGLRNDRAAAQEAWQGFRHTTRRQRERGEDWWVTSARFQMVDLAAAVDDIDGAARELLLEWHPLVDTRDLENNNERRTGARSFVSACIDVLEREASLGHPREADIGRAMDDVASRAADMLTPDHHDGFRRIKALRAERQALDAIDASRRSPGSTGHRLPPIRQPTRPVLPPMREEQLRALIDAGGELDRRTLLALADAALAAAETQDDTRALDALLWRLAQDATAPSLVHLLQALRHVLAGAVGEATGELTKAVVATDRLAKTLQPLIHATRGRIRMLLDPDALAAGIADCRTGRRVGLRWWRRTTMADTSLAGLLLWRALRPGAGPGQRAADVREAVRLARRRCRPWHHPGAEDRLVLHEALTERDAVTGRGTHQRRRRAWRTAVEATPGPTEQARLATAWVAWAVGTGDPELAAEAYQHLVALIPLDAAARSGTSAKGRVLAAAQEHIEDAGYWLARSQRYREAVVALETGRAIALTQAVGGEGERVPAVEYPDITAATEDGALLYIAAAKAGGSPRRPRPPRWSGCRRRCCRWGLRASSPAPGRSTTWQPPT